MRAHTHTQTHYSDKRTPHKLHVFSYLYWRSPKVSPFKAFIKKWPWVFSLLYSCLSRCPGGLKHDIPPLGCLGPNCTSQTLTNQLPIHKQPRSNLPGVTAIVWLVQYQSGECSSEPPRGFKIPWFLVSFSSSTLFKNLVCRSPPK